MTRPAVLLAAGGVLLLLVTWAAVSARHWDAVMGYPRRDRYGR